MDDRRGARRNAGGARFERTAGRTTAAISQVFAHTITDNCGFHLAVFVGVQLGRWPARKLLSARNSEDSVSAFGGTREQFARMDKWKRARARYER